MNFSILGNGRISCLINGWPFVGTLLKYGYNTFLEIHLDVCNFAKLVDLHFRQRMNLKLETNLLLILADEQSD